MNQLKQITNRMWLYGIISIIFGVPALIMVLFGILKYGYHSIILAFKNPNHPLNNPHNIHTYQKSNFLSLIWKYSPTPTFNSNINTDGNYEFAFFFIIMVICIILYKKATYYYKIIKESKDKALKDVLSKEFKRED